MIKFFRRIRQKLLSENKFSKYLLYAIGEIVLVVIGILIALQINNWNERRKEETVITKYTKRLIQDLEKDITYYQRLDSTQQKNLVEIGKIRDTFLLSTNTKGFKYVVEHLDESLPELYISSKTYDEMVSTGVLYAIDNKEVLTEIQDYYNWSVINKYYIQASNNDIAAFWLKSFYDYVAIAKHKHKNNKVIDGLELKSFNGENTENSIALKAYLLKYYETEESKYRILKDQITYGNKLITVLKENL